VPHPHIICGREVEHIFGARLCHGEQV
jgi:hypothetical protein